MRAWTGVMRSGDWAAAWAISDSVLAARDPAGRDDPALPCHQRWVWDGRPLHGAHVTVRCYHGLGDTLMCARLLPALAARAASVTVEAQAALLPLLARLPGLHRLVPFNPAHPLPPGGVDVEIMELSHALRLAPDTVRADWLRVVPAALPADTLALCPGQDGWDPARRLPAELLGPVCRRHPCVLAVPEPTRLPVANPQGCTADVMETAALLAGAAQVVTVDTMVAHLALALGRPTHVLLKSDPDWRWGEAGASPWYPAARLHRQPAAGDWQAAVASVERALHSGPFVEREEPHAAVA